MPKMADDAAARIFADGEKKTNGHDREPVHFVHEDDFLADFQPPDWLIDGILQRHFIYALTGQTGHAKTAIALALAELVGYGGDNDRFFGVHRVRRGRVGYFAGENPYDIQVRRIGARSLRPNDPRPNIYYRVGAFDIAQTTAAIIEDTRRIGGLDLLFVDTSAAYFFGEEEQSNTQMGIHANTLRRLTELPGKPCVVALCHPTKHAKEQDDLLPRGGGAFLAAMDGNLTARKHNDTMIELSYTKLRGPEFEPMTLRLEPVKTTRLQDINGDIKSTVHIVVVGKTEEQNQEDSLAKDDDRVLIAMLSQHPRPMSFVQIAEHLSWINDKGEPTKARVQRANARLEDYRPKTIQKDERGVHWVLTEHGADVARKAALAAQSTEKPVEQVKLL